MSEDWLDNINKKYTVNVDVTQGSNSFISKVYTFNDPSKKGLSFIISVNDTSIPSAFDCHDFPFTRFNIAEEVAPDDILAAATLCLNGDLKFKKAIFGSRKYKLEFNLPTFKGFSSARLSKSSNKPLYSAYKIKSR